MMVDYTKLVREHSGYVVEATDPTDYNTIVWEITETRTTMDEENEVVVDTKVPVTPIPIEELEALFKAMELEKLKVDVAEKITQGYVSDALGSNHIYNSTIESQINIIGAVMAGVDMYYACIDENGVKDMRLHTTEQIKKVFADGVIYKQTLMSEYYSRRNFITNATTEELKNL